MIANHQVYHLRTPPPPSVLRLLTFKRSFQAGFSGCGWPLPGGRLLTGSPTSTHIGNSDTNLLGRWHLATSAWALDQVVEAKERPPEPSNGSFSSGAFFRASCHEYLCFQMMYVQNQELRFPPLAPGGGAMVPLGGLIVPARSHLPPISVRFAREPHAFGANFVGLVDGWRLFQAQGQGRDRHAKI